jgi:hypothetical protein
MAECFLSEYQLTVLEHFFLLLLQEVDSSDDGKAENGNKKGCAQESPPVANPCPPA